MKRKYHNFIIKKEINKKKKNLRILMLKNFYLKRTKELFAVHCRLGKITFRSHNFF
jgi:Holliday junction resolvase-like predicted endonuclease